MDPSGYDWIESPGYVEFTDDPLTGSTPVGEGEIPSGELDALWEVYGESSLYSSMPIVAAEPPVSDGNYADPAGAAPARTESHGADARGAQGPLRCVGCPDGLAADNIGPVGGVAITSLVGARFLVKLVYGLSLAARTMPVAATGPAVAGAVQSKADTLTRTWEAARGGAGVAARFDPTRAGHVFREAAGHVNPASAGSQARFAQLFEHVASNPANLRPDAVQAGIITQDAANAGVQAFTWMGDTGQIWVTVRNGVIQNAGVNPLEAFR